MASSALALSCSLPHLALVGRQAARHAQKLRLPAALHIHILQTQHSKRHRSSQRMASFSTVTRFALSVKDEWFSASACFGSKYFFGVRMHLREHYCTIDGCHECTRRHPLDLHVLVVWSKSSCTHHGGVSLSLIFVLSCLHVHAFLNMYLLLWHLRV